MTSPQLTDANTSSEWFPTVAGAGGGEKPRSPSQAAIPTDARRRRFVRLVTFTMVGLVAFTLVGVASFAWRRHSMRAALEAPVATAAPALAVPAVAAPAVVAAAASETEAQPSSAAVSVVATAVKPKVVSTSAKPARKAVKRSPFLSSVKTQAQIRR
jgi:hypothetical protein